MVICDRTRLRLIPKSVHYSRHAAVKQIFHSINIDLCTKCKYDASHCWQVLRLCADKDHGHLSPSRKLFDGFIIERTSLIICETFFPPLS